MWIGTSTTRNSAVERYFNVVGSVHALETSATFAFSTGSRLSRTHSPLGAEIHGFSSVAQQKCRYLRGGGSLGSTIARAIAKEGANVFLAGRRLSAVKQVADEIVDSGGCAEAALVDAMNESEVNAFVDSMTRKGETLDLSLLCDRLPGRAEYPAGSVER